MERRLMDTVLPRGRDLRELLTISPLNRRRTLRFLFVLQGLQMLAFQPDRPGYAVTDDPLDALASRLNGAMEGHYEALGLHITAHPDEFEESIQQIRETYGRHSALSQHSARARELCTQVVSRAEDAYRFLMNKGQRVAYRKERHTQTELVGYAQLLIDKMKIAILRDENHRALRLREVATELAPHLVRRELTTLIQKTDDDT